MKRITLLSLAVLVIAGCGDHKADYLCGNGKLDSNEMCDGELFAEGIRVLCTNKVRPNYDLLKCTNKCSLDSSVACAPSCGNGAVEGDEQCDGNVPDVVAACDNPDLSKLSCVSCRILDSGVCPAPKPVDPGQTTEKPEWIPQTCGNDTLDSDELCDGTIIREEAKTCPAGMVLKQNPTFKCLDSCRLVDISEACDDTSGSVCGNGVREPGEDCDQTDFSEDAFAAIVCPDGQKLDASKATCSDKCKIDNACFDKTNEDAGVLISEVVPHFSVSGASMTIDGFAVEITNMSKTAAELDQCALALMDVTQEHAVQKKFGIESLIGNMGTLSSFETKVICSQKDADKFDGACDAVIEESWSGDGIINNLKGMTHLGIVCGETDAIVDLFNLTSFNAAVEQSAVDFVRLCDADPATEIDNAVLGVGWLVSIDTTYAPKYGLGSHCENTDANVASCHYTISRNDLSDRTQSVELALEIEIPGVSDKTDKTDASPSTQIQFISGEVKDNAIHESIIHVVFPTADPEWTNDKGIDRYIGTLRNWDTYEGFLYTEAGSYVLDAAISFDSGQTRVFCGPKGIIKNYENYDPTQRNTLVVAYDDEGGICNDGVISSSEVCDGRLVLNDALECENKEQAVGDMDKLSCSCQMLSTLNACQNVPDTCGNGIADEGEACDGSDIWDSAKVCPGGYTVLDNPVWECTDSCLRIDHTKACEPACGNGKLDVGEVCDGALFVEDALVCPKGYVLVDDPQWACDTTCTKIVNDGACVNACGNGKLDNNEICDGTLFDKAAAEAACQKGVYEQKRASCLDTCEPDPASCIPNVHLVFDEFIAHTDDKGKVDGVAITIANVSETDYDAGNCNLWIYNEKGTLSMHNSYSMTYYSLLDIAGTDQSSYMLNQCKPLAFSTENVSSEDIYHNVFNDMTTSLGIYDENKNLQDNFLMNENVVKMRITCDGQTIDAFDAKGMREAINEGFRHGKLKSADRLPWPSVDSVKLKDRMDLDKTYPIESMLAPCD
ncbi:MAG: hypothetical protein J6A01_09385 [Proteobacteria bacterium]|nr:hypothetical protein [Pseudomonadota bacterium]